MPLAKVVEITRQIGGALDAAHAEGVVHRDLKSDNIMLIDNAGGDFAKVLDFGIAKIKEPEGEYDPGLTAPNLVIGTPQYMSPEQCSQLGEIDSRSDIYSFGVILYEMFVGHVPFTGESPTAIMMKHLQEPVPSLLEERSDLPASVVRVVARAMAKLPDNRYQKIGDLVEDLTIAGAAQVSSPVSASKGHRSASQATSNISDADDEVTVVRPRAIAVPVAAMPANASYPPPSISSFNPMKILIPSAAALLLIFAVIYAFTRNADNGKNANANQPQTTLAADPNGQPVQPAEPATGKGEMGIPAGGATNPAANANLNANVKSSPTPLDEPGINPGSSPNENANKNANANANNDSKAPALPSPTRNVNPEDVPAPSPSGAKTPVSKPSPVAPVPTPTDPSS